MSEARFTVFVVDDDIGITRAVSRLLSLRGYNVESYTSPQEFLARHDASVPGCAVLDVSMPALDGLELQQQLEAKGADRPIIFITGHGDIPTTVRAMKAGAIDFLTKPVSNDALLAAIARAQERDASQRQTQSELRAVKEKLATLTPREREVLTHVVGGRLNKQIAFDLGTVEQTIKFHRSAIMRKLGARSIIELVHMTEKAGFPPNRTTRQHWSSGQVHNSRKDTRNEQ